MLRCLGIHVNAIYQELEITAILCMLVNVEQKRVSVEDLKEAHHAYLILFQRIPSHSRLARFVKDPEVCREHCFQSLE